MRDLLVGLGLGLVVLSAWIGGFGALRLRSSLDRLHAVAFVNAAAGGTVAVAGVVADGVSTRSVKLACLIVVVLVAGAAITHASGQALTLRDGPQA